MWSITFNQREMEINIVSTVRNRKTTCITIDTHLLTNQSQYNLGDFTKEGLQALQFWRDWMSKKKLNAAFSTTVHVEGKETFLDAVQALFTLYCKQYKNDAKKFADHIAIYKIFPQQRQLIAFLGALFDPHFTMTESLSFAGYVMCPLPLYNPKSSPPDYAAFFSTVTTHQTEQTAAARHALI